MIPTEMISALLLVRVLIDDDASLSTGLSSLDCSSGCANRTLEVVLGRESDSWRGRGVRDDKSDDMATDGPFFFFVPRETREFMVVGAR